MLRFRRSQLNQYLSGRQLASVSRYGKRIGMYCEKKNPVWMGWSPG
jgi:hypothetical protein